jgi:hypothetical protein
MPDLTSLLVLASLGGRLIMFAFFVDRQLLVCFRSLVLILLLAKQIFRTFIELLSIRSHYLADYLKKRTNNWCRTCKSDQYWLMLQVNVIPEVTANPS